MDYKNGKIYTIRSYQTDKFYIGSTCSTLTKRFSSHKSRYKNGTYKSTAIEIVKYNDCYIELLEAFECKNKNELRQREGELIRKYKDNIVNCRIENRTMKQYSIDNKDKIKQYTKQYNTDNADKIKQNNQQYYYANKEKIKKRAKQYRINNNEKISKQYMCECGKTYRHKRKSRHKKSYYHINYINNPFINFKL